MNTQEHTTDPTRRATMADFAAADFEPWKKEENVWTPPQGEDWRVKQAVLFMVLNYSFDTLHKSKAELMAEIDGWSEEKGELMQRAFLDITSFLNIAKTIVEGAEARILCACSSLEIEGGNA